MYESVRIKKEANRLLKEISDKRKAEGNLICTKISVLSDIINKQHKREMKS